MKTFDPYLSAAKLQITPRERTGLIHVARMMPTIPHKPQPHEVDGCMPPLPPLKAFDMSHVRCRDAGCGLAWMMELGYIDDPQNFSDAMFFLFYPADAIPYEKITPLMFAQAAYRFLHTGVSYMAYEPW